MALDTYREKRDFARTPEPGPEPAAQGAGPLRFVVQKHRASHLHYDFRLELDGVLKSWAVPKGPSLNPADRRLAMRVEDHPLDYRTFEGTIPEGNYGAGAVIVWDAGAYAVPGLAPDDRAANEQAMRQGLRKGHLRFVLAGEKLRGEFSLVKTRGREPGSTDREEDSWLLIKKADAFAARAALPGDERSVLSGRSLEDVEAGANDGQNGAHAPAAQVQAPPETGKTRSGRPETGPLDIMDLDLHGAPQGKLPSGVKPMLATLVDRPFDRPGWVFELKWDGYRALAEVQGKRVRLYSRKNIDFSPAYEPIAGDLRNLGLNALFDGEIVVIGPDGRPAFPLLQNWASTARGRLVYYVFDLLYLEGYNLQPLPLARRQALLRQVLPERTYVKLSDALGEHGGIVFELAKVLGMEGIVAKDLASPYRPGVRGEDWLKVKTRAQQEAVIGGFTEPRGGRK